MAEGRGGSLASKRMRRTLFQQIGMMLLFCIEGIAVNTVEARRLGVIAIDVLRKDVPNKLVGFGHSCPIRHEQDVVVKLVQASVRMGMYSSIVPSQLE